MKIGSEYALSLFRLAKEQGRVPEYSLCLEEINRVISEQKDWLSVLHSPAIPLEERLSLIDKALGGAEIKEVPNFLKLLCEKGYILHLPACIEEFFFLKKEWEMRIPVEVRFAYPLSDDQKTKLEKKIQIKTGKIPEIVYREDLSLIGGIRVKIEDAVLDGSLSAKLGTLKGVIKG